MARVNASLASFSALPGFVVANGSMSSKQSGEGDIRRATVEAYLMDCMVAVSGWPC